RGSEAAKGLLGDLDVDVARFETAFERRLYSSLALARGLFLPRESFGRDVLLTGDPLLRSGDALTQRLANARPLPAFVAELPIADTSKRQILALYDPARDALGGKTVEEKQQILKTTSYRDYLIRHCGCSAEAANCFRGLPYGFFGLGSDAVPAADARDMGYPGFAGLGLPQGEGHSEPYIYHFPDGNAALARLLVRALIPGVAPGDSMDDVVLAP